MDKTQQQVIKDFMQALVNGKTLDEAVYEASDGKYKTMYSLKNKFTYDINKTIYRSKIEDVVERNKTKFLLEYCGIDLTNADTGAITGKDAGGSSIDKTAETIVPETDSSDEPNLFDVYFTRNGLNIYSTYFYSLLQSNEQNVIRGLYKWWIEESLNLIEESYGISFKSSGVKFNELKLILDNDENASGQAGCGNGNLIISMKYFPNVNLLESKDGKSTVRLFLDRAIAHELTHAVMEANISSYWDLPDFIKEGMAELTHGADDTRYDDILHMIDPSNHDVLNYALSGHSENEYKSYYIYSAGYTLLRYFAKQVSESSDDTYRTAVDVIHDFVSSLDNTNKRGNAAVNEAIQKSSNFTGLDDLINKFIADINQSSSGDDFLKTYCDINLDDSDKDTGAITGKNAGGSVIKTKETIVPEYGSSKSSYPDENSITYHGLTINFPSKDSLNETQQNIIAGINTWWLKSGLNLAEETYGLSFNDSGAAFNTLDIDFDVSGDPEADSYGILLYNDSVGEAEKFILHINSDHYASLSNNDVNGINTSSTSDSYLDANIANGIKNALLMANIDYNWELPSFIFYGLGRLMMGDDDSTETKSTIFDLISNANKLIEFTLNNNRDLRDSTDYDGAVGYMLMRYLAKNADRVYDTNAGSGTKQADIINVMNNDSVIRTYSGDDVVYNWDSASTIYAGDGNDTIKNYSSDYYDTGKTSDNKNSILHGGAGNDYILNANQDATISGGTGNDVIELADESTNAVIRYASGDGNDTIYGFTAADMLQIISDDYIIETRDEDAIISVPSDDDVGTITVIDGAYTDLNIVTVKGDTIFDDDKIPDDDTTSGGNDDYTINKAKTAVTLSSGFKGTFDLADLAKVKTVVGSQIYNDVEIVGNSKANKLIGGSGKDTLNGGTGKDTLTGNSGADVFVYESGSGKDIIADYEADEDSIVINDGYVSTSSVKGSDVIFKVGKGTLTVKNGKDKEITLTDELGERTRVYGNDMFLTDSYKTKVKAKSKIITIDASARTKDIYINGNSKSNTLIGGSGNDTLTGGAGKDVFYYKSGNDLITDYKASQKDEIILTSGTVDSVAVKGSNVIFTIGDGELTVKSGKSQTITITDAEGNKTSQKYTKSSSFVEESDADSGYWFANDDNFETADIDLMTNTTESNVIAIENGYSLTDKIIDDKLSNNHSAITYNNKLD